MCAFEGNTAWGSNVNKLPAYWVDVRTTHKAQNSLEKKTDQHGVYTTQESASTSTSHWWGAVLKTSALKRLSDVQVRTHIETLSLSLSLSLSLRLLEIKKKEIKRNISFSIKM